MKYISCPICGIKLLQAKDGAELEMTCPHCKSKLIIRIKDNVVMTSSQKEVTKLNLQISMFENI